MEDNSKYKQSHLLDPEQIQMLLEAGADDSLELFTELIGLFEEESQVKLEEIRNSHSDGDFESLGRAAHALAGSSANIGGREVWLKAKEVENLCKSGQGNETGHLLEDLQSTYAETMIQLRYFISQLDSSTG
jgi:HPt (histidine-containing phosphotransfer) domain-containing protein